MIGRGCYSATSVPQGEITAGYAHAEEVGEASVDVTMCCN